MPLLEVPRFKFTGNHINNCILFAMFISSLFMLAVKPVFVLLAIPGGENLEATVARISHTGELVLDDGRHVSAGDVIHLR